MVSERIDDSDSTVRAERMKVTPPSAPSAQSVQTKKKPPVDLAISLEILLNFSPQQGLANRALDDSTYLRKRLMQIPSHGGSEDSMSATLFYDTLATVTPGRRTSAVFAVLLLGSGSGFSVASTGRQDVTWSRDLGLPKLSDINARLNVAEITPAGEPLRMSRGIGGQSEDRIVRTCQEYLNSVSVHFVTASTFDARQEIQFVHDCYVLRDLKGVQPAKQTFLPGWSYEILSVAPPLLQFGEYRDFDPQLGWAATEPRLHGTSITSQSISAEDDTANYELQLVATGDFNRDGVADLAIVGEVRAKEGSYIRGDYYVLTRCGPRGLLVQVSRSNQPFLLDQSRCD